MDALMEGDALPQTDVLAPMDLLDLSVKEVSGIFFFLIKARLQTFWHVLLEKLYLTIMAIGNMAVLELKEE